MTMPSFSGVWSQRVSEGASLRAALDTVGYFPPMLLHMVSSGESSGELDAMLEKVAIYQQAEVERIVTTSPHATRNMATSVCAPAQAWKGRRSESGRRPRRVRAAALIGPRLGSASSAWIQV